ncbi:MAG: polyprenyl synthetase family protein [Immundisolibacter sp.]|uniref:polyprenyl synthetase family protein n=1 Tax=Immundisolibacter sp. TaxID=1934948 RepID=UPI003EDEF37D
MKAVATVGRRSMVAPGDPPLQRALRQTAPFDLADFFDRKLPTVMGVESSAAPSCQAVWQGTLYEPLREFLGRRSKNLRARLVQHGWRLGGGHGAAPSDLCLLPEILHSASLIVDDIQDGAHARRGGAALHRLIGVEQALNAANWLYFWPYALLPALVLPAGRRRRCADLITRALLDCHRGQALDLGVQVWALAPVVVQAVVAEQSRLKTGRLTALCTGLGAIAAGARPDRVALLQQFGEQVGVALQMLDDLTAVLLPARHDKAGEDLRCGRPTWAWALAARECSSDQYHALTASAQTAAQTGNWQPVCAALTTVLAPVGLGPARRALAAAGDLLGDRLAGHAHLGDLRNELDGLERAYG